ncbi:class I SAM-dependent methyltransferase [Streptomyces sp. NPDC048330]|uniref:class I SAM-dependent methyltransferase n=1 Tax=Streptomyces sp. NPDC048330 TaxID=3365533 RepID=UPI0037140F3A
MSTYELASEVRAFYEHAIDEGARLRTSADGRLELLRTREILRQHLPQAPARVLDVGGGTGVHAQWLVEDGYEVHLIDPVHRHVEQAAKICSAAVGDARNLDLPADSYDAVLLLGPLYHLPDPADRRVALREAVRVARPGGLVAAAGINRYSPLFEHVTYAHLHRERLNSAVASILETAVHDGKRGFTLAYFHRAEELAGELTDAGLQAASVVGVEGPAWSALKAVEQQSGQVPSEELFQAVLAAARLADPYPELLAASSHLLAVGRVPAL